MSNSSGPSSDDAKKSKRKDYRKPQLQVYGPMTSLTASGTIPGKENTGSKANELP